MSEYTSKAMSLPFLIVFILMPIVIFSAIYINSHSYYVNVYHEAYKTNLTDFSRPSLVDGMIYYNETVETSVPAGYHKELRWKN